MTHIHGGVQMRENMIEENQKMTLNDFSDQYSPAKSSNTKTKEKRYYSMKH